MSDWLDHLYDDLDALNDFAHTVLDAPPDPVAPEPADCPAPGTWLRVYQVDDDARPVPESPWHVVRGWDERWASLRLRCSARNRPINWVLTHADERVPPGTRTRGTSGWWDRLRLDERSEPPKRGRCRRCVALLARDAALADPLERLS